MAKLIQGGSSLSADRARPVMRGSNVTRSRALVSTFIPVLQPHDRQRKVERLTPCLRIGLPKNLVDQLLLALARMVWIGRAVPPEAQVQAALGGAVDVAMENESVDAI